ncbi:hypothetical protein [Haliangium ochraceum]|uniref:Uncharacterized protein n=1 Tax=Haliangium ochraceum (strain DSM 14365 / JCM 11303 / SMP-2) TaxID=502025 RepID=D0LKJ3_HALO1|nr:hypothetical protein [Haliangium ochraceum]ACY15041.1 hypothetical protein Hoch_2505 [Haliangium ochraceum DSM 14365]
MTRDLSMQGASAFGGEAPLRASLDTQTITWRGRRQHFVTAALDERAQPVLGPRG